jgi:HicB family
VPTAGKQPASSPAPGEPSHSGRLLLRMPKELHARLAARADADGTSLNQLIVATLTGALTGPQRDGADGRSPMPRALRVSLLVNAVVVAVALAAGIALLLVAVR